MTLVPAKTEVRLTGAVGEVIASLGDAVTEVHLCDVRRGIARINPARIVEVAEKIFAMEGARLATITGIDARDGIDLLYHWAFEPAGIVVTLNALAVRPALEMDSIANVLPTANWVERELHELLGANFPGHPDMRRLLLDDSWPEGLHPLRKGFDQILDRPPLPPNVTSPDVPADGDNGGAE